jgi:Rrf2 family protein
MLSMKAKYALRAMTIMAKQEKKTMQTKNIAQEGVIPQKFLEAILVELRKCGLITSKRGVFGGHQLAKPASIIMIGDVIRAIDGTIAPIRCASVESYVPCEDCPDPSTCSISHIMRDVRLAISQVLDERSIKELANYPKPLTERILD